MIIYELAVFDGDSIECRQLYYIQHHTGYYLHISIIYTSIYIQSNAKFNHNGFE